VKESSEKAREKGVTMANIEQRKDHKIRKGLLGSNLKNYVKIYLKQIKVLKHTICRRVTNRSLVCCSWRTGRRIQGDHRNPSILLYKTLNTYIQKKEVKQERL
jgi:hypothetical protein